MQAKANPDDPRVSKLGTVIERYKREDLKRIKPDVLILMFSGVTHVPEGARLYVDAFLQKGQAPTVVLDKIHELLESSHPAA